MRVFFVQHCANHTGSAISGRIIVEGFIRRGWSVETAFGFEGPSVVDYANTGCQVRIVPHKNWLRGKKWSTSCPRIFAEWRNANDFMASLAQATPDVVYVNSLVSLAAAVAARRLGIPCIWHLRELFDDLGGEMHVPGIGGRFFVRQILHRLSILRIAISQIVAQNILGVSNEPGLEVVSNAVSDEFSRSNLSAANCRRKWNLPPDVPLVGVPGTLRPVKGHPFFFQAAAALSQHFPECCFAVTGDGDPDYKSQLLRQVAELGLEQKTFFLGSVADMANFYRACDVVCVPSVSESFGRTVIEAYAAGVPVVATEVGGMKETVAHNQTGLLVPYGDVDSMSSALNHLLQSPVDRSRLATAGAQEFETRYSAKAHQDRICDLLCRTIQSFKTAQAKLAG